MQRSVLRYAACVSVALLLAGVFCRPAMAGENITYPGVPLRPGLFDNAVNSIYPTAGFTGNTVTVYGGDIPGNVAGGVNFFEEDGTVSGNHVFFKDGVVGQNIIGAITNTGLASGNSVEISGGYVAGKSAGAVVLNVTDPAYGSVFLATDNSLTLTGGYVAQEVYGGYSVGSATNNRVVISGGTVGWSISGGFAGGYSGLAFEGDASGNSVTMSGGSVEGVSVPLHDNFLPDSGVYGGTSRTGNANDNTVHISGGTVVGHVSGGSRIQDLFNGTITGTAIRNTVTLSGNPNLTAAALFGGETIGTDDVFTGNTLNVFGFSGSVLGAANFQYYNLAIPAFMQNGGTVLNITGGVPVELAGTTVRVGIMGGGKHLTVGDSVTLISSADNAGPMSTQGMKGVSLL